MIQPGLERIGLLLKNKQFPWKAIHVAGTNGKGSICAYAAAILSRSNVRVGRFTSPHLIHRWDCITIDGDPVKESVFRRVEDQFLQLNEEEKIQASEFEVLTATAFQLFNEHKVEVGVVEVGMGGKLDATNILNNQVVSVISKIARDHQNFLGNTLEEIAKHKAGILRPGIPYIVNPMNEPHVQNTINQVAKDVGAGTRVHADTDELARDIWSHATWTKFCEGKMAFQRDNAVLALLAATEALRSLGQSAEPQTVREFMPPLRDMTFPGRFHTVGLEPVYGYHRDILVDGAHNEDAATELNRYVEQKQRSVPMLNDGEENSPPQDGWPVTWIMAMTEGKDVREYLSQLLRHHDTLVTTSFEAVDGMPWVKSMDPHELLRIAKDIQPGITGLAMSESGPHRALCAAKYITNVDHPVVLTGSLYLIGQFLREREAHEQEKSALDIPSIDKQAHLYVNRHLSTEKSAGEKA